MSTCPGVPDRQGHASTFSDGGGSQWQGSGPPSVAVSLGEGMAQSGMAGLAGVPG